MIRLSVERILLLHQLMIAQTGGSDGVRDMGLLESAVESMYVSFDGKDLYPGKEEKAARLGFSLIANHAFVDGNKRIGMYAMLTFLEVNGIHIECSNEDVIHLGLGVASGIIKYEEVLDWIRSHQV